MTPEERAREVFARVPFNEEDQVLLIANAIAQAEREMRERCAKKLERRAESYEELSKGSTDMGRELAKVRVEELLEAAMKIREG